MSASCSKMAQVHCCLSNLRYGYPVKHPLSEQFGMTLLQPLRLWKEILFSLFGLTKQLHPTILFAFIEQDVKTFKLSFTTCWVAGNMLLNTCTKIIANLYALSEKDYCFSSPQATMLHACMFAALLSRRHRLPSGHEIRFLVYSTQAPLHAFQLCIDMMVQNCL